MRKQYWPESFRGTVHVHAKTTPPKGCMAEETEEDTVLRGKVSQQIIIQSVYGLTRDVFCGS